jgi:hypothetical protein
MDFFLWGHIEAPIYTSPVDSEEDLIACIVEAANFRLHPAFSSAHVSLCSIVIGCVSEHTSEHQL